jgi:Tol biopolymer transport system component
VLSTRSRLAIVAAVVCAFGAVAVAPALAINEIAYECGGRGIDICLLDPANPGAVTNLTDNGEASYDKTPIWSPDGKKVAFVSDYTKAGHGNWNVFVMDTTAADQAVNLATQITDYAPPEKVEISDLAWSPDGSRIAFTRGNNSGGDQVIVDNADGTSVFPLPIGGPGNNRFPSWSPDSSKIAYATTKNAPEQIYVVSSQGGIGPPLANGVGHEPRWSPDGSKIAFDGYQGGKNFGYIDLHVVSVDGSGTPLIVTPSPFTEWTFGAWSPDGGRIAYRATDSEGKTVYWVMNANGTGAHPLATPSGGDAREASWSPDGSRIVYERGPYPATGAADLYVSNADGSGSAQPLTSDGKSYDPSWRVVLATAQAPPPHPGAKKPKVVWITKRIPWTGGSPVHMLIVGCNAPVCSTSTTGKVKGAIAAGVLRSASARASGKPKGGKRPKWIVVGRGKAKLKEGQKRKLGMTINKAGAAILEKLGKATIQVTVTIKVSGRKKPYRFSHAIHVYFKKSGKTH